MSLLQARSVFLYFKTIVLVQITGQTFPGTSWLDYGDLPLFERYDIYFFPSVRDYKVYLFFFFLICKEFCIRRFFILSFLELQIMIWIVFFNVLYIQIRMNSIKLVLFLKNNSSCFLVLIEVAHLNYFEC